MHQAPAPKFCKEALWGSLIAKQFVSRDYMVRKSRSRNLVYFHLLSLVVFAFWFKIHWKLENFAGIFLRVCMSQEFSESCSNLPQVPGTRAESLLQSRQSFRKTTKNTRKSGKLSPRVEDLWKACGDARNKDQTRWARDKIYDRVVCTKSVTRMCFPECTFSSKFENKYPFRKMENTSFFLYARFTSCRVH